MTRLVFTLRKKIAGLFFKNCSEKQNAKRQFWVQYLHLCSPHLCLLILWARFWKFSVVYTGKNHTPSDFEPVEIWWILHRKKGEICGTRKISTIFGDEKLHEFIICSQSPAIQPKKIQNCTMVRSSVNFITDLNLRSVVRVKIQGNHFIFRVQGVFFQSPMAWLSSVWQIKIIFQLKHLNLLLLLDQPNFWVFVYS